MARWTIAEPIQVSEEEVAKNHLFLPLWFRRRPRQPAPPAPIGMTGNLAEGSGPVVLQSLTSFINLILRGEAAPFVRPSLFRAILTALNKKGGKVRSIALGRTLRRLAGKCAGNRVMQAMGALLALHQESG